MNPHIYKLNYIICFYIIRMVREVLLDLKISRSFQSGSSRHHCTKDKSASLPLIQKKSTNQHDSWRETRTSAIHFSETYFSLILVGGTKFGEMSRVKGWLLFDDNSSFHLLCRLWRVPATLPYPDLNFTTRTLPGKVLKISGFRVVTIYAVSTQD